MGNTNSNKNNEKGERDNESDLLKETSFGEIIDYIATKYILTMDFQNLTKLQDKNYCDNLIVLTSNIIERYFTDLEVEFLSQRIKNGVEENIMKKDKVIFFDKSKLDEYNVQVSLKKKRVCMGIAKFYVKIAHVFSAIVTTINPVYIYKDVDNNVIQKTLMEKNNIPSGAVKKLYKLGICDRRIQSLKIKKGDILFPKVCEFNVNKFGETKNLAEEPGINELMQLYYDKYDYNTGTFVGMTEETEAQFKKDLTKMYTVFTGEAVMPDEIKKFSDIKLKSFQTMPGCSKIKDEIPIFKQFYKKGDSLQDLDLFTEYADHLKQMMKKTKYTQENLLKIINTLFTYVIDPQTNKKVIRVNPALNNNLLEKTIKDTRTIILDLYTTCEKDYLYGMKLYQALIEKKIKDTVINQVTQLEKISDEILEETAEIKLTDDFELEEIPDKSSS